MSYDYSLFKAPGPGPMESWPADPPPLLGLLEEIRSALSALFPAVSWAPYRDAWFGEPEPAGAAPEFQIIPEADGSVRFITMRRTEREEVERVCAHFGVVAIDPQAMELYSSLTGAWMEVE